MKWLFYILATTISFLLLMFILFFFNYWFKLDVFTNFSENYIYLPFSVVFIACYLIIRYFKCYFSLIGGLPFAVIITLILRKSVHLLSFSGGFTMFTFAFLSIILFNMVLRFWWFNKKIKYMRVLIFILLQTTFFSAIRFLFMRHGIGYLADKNLWQLANQSLIIFLMITFVIYLSEMINSKIASLMNIESYLLNEKNEEKQVEADDDDCYNSDNHPDNDTKNDNQDENESSANEQN